MEIIPIFGMITGILINAIVFAALVLTVRYVTQARNKERMALIEKGVDISEIYKKSESRNNTLKAGMFLVGIGLGIFAGYLLASMAGMNGVVSYFTGILLFGGASLILFHWYHNRQAESGA
jgi:predicted membrane channel-forming protein YqfA (hemolysin III family)